MDMVTKIANSVTKILHEACRENTLNFVLIRGQNAPDYFRSIELPMVFLLVCLDAVS